MSKLIFLVAALTVVTAHGAAKQSASPDSAAQDLQTGMVIGKVVCAAQPGQSYALYIPSHYTREKRWPIVYVFDPGARGRLAVELMKDAAERYGYIVAGSNNSHNGPTKQELEAAQAMSQDTSARLAIDNKRVYFAGLSGGARFAASLAQGCKCAAGVLLNSAGFAPFSPPARDDTFSVFATAGSTDFNYREVVDLDAKLRTLHYVHAFRGFEGPHEWAPASVIEEAFAWFRLISMKEWREARDLAFVKDQAAEAENRAKALQLAGDAYVSWKEYRQAAETFEGLCDTLRFRESVAALEKEKAVREGAKGEQREFEEQSRLSADISSGLAALREDSPDSSKLRSEIEMQISRLRSRADHEKNPRELRVVKRALGGVLVEAMEAGQERLEAKDNSLARTYFELAATADPDSVWALGELAATRALAGDRRGAFEALGRAREKSKDFGAFAEWLKEEPAFAKLRDTPEFRALLAPAQNPH